MLDTRERQVAPDLSGIRRDHVARYEWAARQLAPGSRVVDLACGVGYGAKILADAGHSVLAIDRDAEAIAYAREHYGHERITYRCSDAAAVELPDEALDAAVTFETIEHLADPAALLAKLRAAAPLLLASVPNETVFPFRAPENGFQGWAYHHRHYTRQDFAGLLRRCGFRAEAWLGQDGRESEVEPLIEGRTLIVKAVHEESFAPPAPAAPSDKAASPHHVAIVALGPTCKDYFELVKNLGGRNGLADEVWAINSLGNVIACDRVFHMDDVAVQERRAAAKPDGGIARMLEWLRGHPGPIYTSVVRPGYPGMVPFPLEEVLAAGGMPYFNNTVAYAIAYARHIGVKKLSVYGADFTRQNIHHGEQGRACCEFWLGLCAAAGIAIEIPGESALMDACAPDGERLYGYDGVDVLFHDGADGGLRLEMRPKELPTAEEIERRYDHTLHPNRLMRAKA